MAIGIATVNLRSIPVSTPRSRRVLQLLLKVEAWLDRRASGRALHRMDDRALADIGLSRADVEGVDDSASWQSLLMTPAGRR